MASAHKKRVIALAPYERGWSNVELIKDCGLIPYLLYKNHNCDVSMVGVKSGDYPYLDSCVKGLQMDFLADGREETKLTYLEREAPRTDCLILRGCYGENFAAARVYKQYNPNGKIYVGLDASGHWMDTLLWYHPLFIKFMGYCDVIATSSRTVQEYLNIKWPWKIHCIPNGFYDFSAPPVRALPFSDKDNVILMVARLGFPSKCTPVLVNAFARIAEDIPDWTLHLVGPTSPEFATFMDTFYTQHPNLSQRVHCSGSIQDRRALRREYLRAKIFAFPSISEGGTPNVIAEALNAGCAMAVGKFDAYREAIDDGRCGLAAESTVDAFSAILLSLCDNPRLQDLCDHALTYGTKYFNMERITARLYEMIFGET